MLSQLDHRSLPDTRQGVAVQLDLGQAGMVRGDDSVTGEVLRAED
jgi:hypothetical protein